jgi:hypothetical protein
MTTANEKTTKAPKKLTIGALIDKMNDLREDKRVREAAIKIVEEEYSALEARLIEQMDAEGTPKSTGKKAGASIGEVTRYNPVDWDMFFAFCAKHKYSHLIERRPSVSGCEELMRMKGVIPGLEPYTKRKINLRSL